MVDKIEINDTLWRIFVASNLMTKNVQSSIQTVSWPSRKAGKQGNGIIMPNSVHDYRCVVEDRIIVKVIAATLKSKQNGDETGHD